MMIKVNGFRKSIVILKESQASASDKAQLVCFRLIIKYNLKYFTLQVLLE